MTIVELENDLKAAIRTIPDYPKPGIMFRDITTLLGDARAFRRAVDELVHPWAGGKIDKVAGIEARGFILGGAIAHQVSAGFVPIRKKGKLPFKRVTIGYSLEYGIDEMEMHEDAVITGRARHSGRRSRRDRRHRRGRGEAPQGDRRRGVGRLLHHRSARTRRRGENQKARRAGAHAGELRGALAAVRREIGFALLALAAVAAASCAGQLATFPNLAPWYAGLTKPSFNPPNWVFGPVWTALYALMAFSLWRVLRLPHHFAARRWAITLFFVQLVLNAAWSWMFFAAHSPLLGLINIVPQWMLVVATIVAFHRLDKIAAWCLMPLAAWVAFAGVLKSGDLAIERLKRPERVAPDA